MLKTVETSAKTIDDAVGAALLRLREIRQDLTKQDVTIEVLEKPKSGFFGFGSIEAKVRVSYELKPIERAVIFVTGLLEHMGIEATVEGSVTEDDSIELNITGENMGIVIGRRGDTLDALQYITSITVNRGEENHIKVAIDTENYRKKREEILENLAKKVAGRVLKFRKSVTLEPMSPYERRIIHATLQGYKGISTYSTGSDPNRRVVIALVGNRMGSVRTPRPSTDKPTASGNVSTNGTVSAPGTESTNGTVNGDA